MKKLFFITIFVFLIIPFSLIQGAIVVCTQTPCSWQNFVDSLTNLIRTVVEISFWVAFLIVAIGAFFVMFGGPFPDRVNKGKSMIWTAIIAYAVILFSGIIFDIILEFFAPQFRPTSYLGPEMILAQTTTLRPGTFYDFFKEALMSSLECGKNAQPLFNSPSLGRLFACFFEIIGLLTRIALVLLAFAIIASAFYLVTTPLFGFKQISRAYQILIWSTIGFIIVLLADIIRAQIERIVK
jgi:hypothetical protein